MNKKTLYPLLLLAAGLGLAYLVAVNKPELEAQPREQRLRTVRVVAVEAGTEFLTISSQGTVQPRSQSELIPEVSGRVKWISPALIGGGAFKKDEVLLRIDDADYRTAMQRSEASQDRSEVEAAYAGDELKRMEKLFNQKLASQSQLDTTRRAARVASANLADSRAALDQARRDLERTQLTAPFDGLVRQEQVDLGQFISRGNSIGTIYATDFVEIRLPVAGDQLRYLGLPVSHRGQIPEADRPPVVISARFGNTEVLWEGELVRTEAEMDERSRMLYGVARIKLTEDESVPTIPVGLFVQAEIRGQRVENVIRLPRSSMRDNDQVLVVDGEQRLRFRHVAILRLEHDEVLINAGLKDGELVSVSPMQTVVDGMRVKALVE